MAGGVASVLVISGFAEGILSKTGCSTKSWGPRVGGKAGDTDVECCWPCRDWVELCALGFELPGIRFFRSLFGCFFSVSAVGDLLKKFDTVLSLTGVSSCFSFCSPAPSNLSWLATADDAA